MAAWIRGSAFLFLGLVLAPKICSVVAGWLDYLLLMRPRLRKQPRGACLRKEVDLKVIACGFSRTGTMSLTQALDTLGFPCIHGFHICQPSRANLFMKAYKSGNPTDWKKFLHGFAAIADYPAAAAYKELAAIFPNAKVILTTRDANKWYDSFSQTIVKHALGHDYKVFKVVSSSNTKCATISVNKKFFNGKLEDRDVCTRAFLQHIHDVKCHVPPEKLLVYNIEEEEGWSTLCNFLDVPIPNVPFPKINARRKLNDDFVLVGRLYTWVFSLYIISVSCLWMLII